ncbi:VanW family protein [Arcanobacterium bovis]|uniref:YoaR-like putative peptidoglycan binding domain-containing protein n=1 Tax=Arcanobacterium bovis TaxID=2529275 RepID=A0A4Q9V218_9ACTO|nr:VanW family protein [Arcanobacterium bovis]TBW23656.1 hypothetical protein EZJ44_00485 [Arcanobacterium bovis]
MSEEQNPRISAQSAESSAVPQASGSKEYWNWDEERAKENQAHKARMARSRKRWIIGLSSTVVVLMLAYVALAFYLGARIPSNTEVSGVPVGGLTKDEAKTKLESELQTRTQMPRTVTVQDSPKTVSLNPADFSLRVDADASLNRLVGFSLNPARMIAHFTGGQQSTAIAQVDNQKLASVLDGAIAQLKVDPVEPTIKFDSSKASIVTTPAKNGVAIEREKAASYLVEHWFAADDKVTLPSKSVSPQVTNEALADFVKNQVDPVISKPISVLIREKVVDLEPRDLGGFLVFDAKAGKLAVSINKAPLKEFLRTKSGGILKDPVDARIEIVNHTTPTVIPSQPGEVVDLDKLSQDLLSIGTRSDRTVTPQIVHGEPEFTTEQAQKLGVKEVVSEMSTPITSDPVRTTNLRVGSQKISNRVIKPGEDFNLEQLLGEITTAQGFVSSGVLVDGFGSEAVGGGLSQLSTNTFNVGYRAGMVDVEHRPHTQYYSRYPAGLESTLWSGQINMIWKNNTPYGAVVDSYVADGRLVTRLWSSKHWDVQVWSGPRQNLVPATTEVNKKKDCTPYGPGNPGFTITVGRKVSLNGQIHEDSTLTWRYNPQNGATCQ